MTLIERLRRASRDTCFWETADDTDEAADRIEALEARVERLEDRIAELTDMLNEAHAWRV